MYNEELPHLYSSPDIIQVIGSRKMRWTGLVTLTGGGIMDTQGVSRKTWRKESSWKT